MTPERRKYLVVGGLATLLLILDQWTKVLVREHVKPLGYTGMSVFGDVIRFQYVENTGITFGMFRSLPYAQLILSAVAIPVFLLVIHLVRQTPADHYRLHVALGLVGAGIGNLIDRVRLGSVTDFVVADLGFWPLNPWYAFNVADAALVVGAILMAFDSRRPKPAPAPAPAPSQGD
ncbi:MULTISPECIES: signal peptidase II [Myxococcus]|uniref:Lipoprotein signal peptidase n=1 Tax=Myxococcus xanthus TaxID=34 RepID=A0AAE6G1G3_MYXXA|nr:MULTISPECIES: signal peptidase II [Myxococcus]QDE68971.1 signal peptidase II [Myxococcus xanthus]QDE76247.1 signal peptidase II [Myxococcus xanthus]QDE83671.1 signal peptidase II [Myxococcus xanthus]QDE97798.1 signal peptidase II [Myxococcus xanthus]QDF05484.1 signal peptidase II [Myxococcus xanthus]